MVNRPSVHARFLKQGAAFLLVVMALALAPERACCDTRFTVRQSYSVKDLPEGAKRIRGWFWMPEDRPEQRVLDFRIVAAPPSLQITRDPTYGRSWLYADVAVDPAKPLHIATEFKVLRRKVSGLADERLAGPITDEHRRAFAAELRLDEKGMEVTPKLRKIADDLAGKEKNPVRQARKFFDYVIEKSDHYSKYGPMPKGLCLGSANECIAGTGDCCSDQHALFIALCRARDIPCRFMFGSRLLPENAGKDFDPGYRCWPNFFAPGLGWVPLDISSADAWADRAEDWFGGLDENRLEWAEGRDFELEPRSQVRPDLVIRGWVEVDGKPHSGIVRVLNFRPEPLAAIKAKSTTAK